MENETNKAPHGKEEKFFFNMNIFDEDALEEEEPEEDLPPPPPTFSEAELEATRKQGFENGKKEGLRESEESRNQYVAQVLENISREIPALLNGEEKRERIYEEESIKLVLQVFEKLFPLYQEKLGFDELKKTLTDILKRQEGQKQISIKVHPEAAEGIQKHIESLPTTETATKFVVSGDESLSKSACRLSWEDGGAVRDAEALAEELKSSIEQVLAGRAAKGHDGDNNNESGPEPAADEEAESETEDIEAKSDDDIMEKSDE